MIQSDETIRQTLRGHGLRSTPQRHAILKAFRYDAGEHLSAEEIHSRASRSLGTLSRGTVYAALTELTDLGLLSAVGVPEPVRYELNTVPHNHFRCRLCMRLFDLDSDPATVLPKGPARALVERVDLRSEGICADCLDYEAGLENGVKAIFGGAKEHLWSQALRALDIACVTTDSPLGTIVLAASRDGVVRLAFEDHFDAIALRERAASRRGPRAARAHLKVAVDALGGFLAGNSQLVDCVVDPVLLSDAEPALSATRAIPYGGHSSYTALDGVLAARELGLWMGANPMPVIFPCHRLTRGKEIPKVFVGGKDRRRWLETHEREHAPLLPRMRSTSASES
jgi:Fe2+ or Zn2+ uptake regulation protein/O6-methylguanine-DNA--protein-cysteine methyltransferase